jgi:hypothetical protein
MTTTLRSFTSRMAIAAILLFSATAARASVILTAATPQVTVGSPFDVDVIATDLNLGGYQLQIGFPPLLASLNATVFDNYLGAPLSFTSAQEIIDTIELDEVSFADSATLLALQGDAAGGNQYRLATMTFLALQPGNVDLTFVSSVLTDLDGNMITSDLLGTTVTITDSTTPADIPEPGTSLLLGSALCGLALLRRRNRRT